MTAISSNTVASRETIEKRYVYLMMLFSTVAKSHIKKLITK
jgi:hypothetical protein